ncbi:predicted protein [Postia placenta Mad-698-R]|uniref:NADP-dependent oxidoreductase domain-containing protein n=1 Tax=Postia placenta MAD-698-R-SB12 TaxID=670580 RepID=A0A1X6NB96_9APHY|nr:hypothetical protein POSPLADRAFT_1133463 [Postia placenta MAD-698-R-SB12]EED81558.1 predicted protein [Postia placenta Mad-698-R]OSX65915.1 hypothetical protein POSPLADRAFT_1133463 [Postia placenta MAD-698-R-SB12]
MTICKIIYGTAWKQETTTALVVSAVLQGFRAIDTACQPKHYREELVGEALRILREEHGIQRQDLFIQTKYTSLGGQDTTKPLPYNPHDSITTQVETSFRKSLRNLGTTYLDSLLLHSPLEQMSQTLEAWQVLIRLQDEGKVKMIGVSNTYDVNTLELLAKATGRRVQIVQNRWYEGNRWDREVCSYCRKNGVQYQSFWTLSGSPKLLAHQSLREIARTKSCTPPQAVFRLAQLQGITPLSGTTNEQHMRQDVEAEQIDLGDVDAAVKEVTKLVLGV